MLSCRGSSGPLQVVKHENTPSVMSNLLSSRFRLAGGLLILLVLVFCASRFACFLTQPSSGAPQPGFVSHSSHFTLTAEIHAGP